jgi:hypothetical protein
MHSSICLGSYLDAQTHDSFDNLTTEQDRRRTCDQPLNTEDESILGRNGSEDIWKISLD